MTTEQLKNILCEGFHKDIKVKQKRPNLFQVFVPFYYPDGDMLDVFIEPVKDGFVIKDLGLTLMKLSYDFELNTNNKREIFHKILANYQVNENADVGIWTHAPAGELFVYLMNFIQVIVKISDLNLLKKETVKSLFYEYFNEFVFTGLEKFDPKKDHSPDFDKKERLYPSPYIIIPDNHRPISIFPVANDTKCNEVTITALEYERHGFDSEKLVVFESMESIARKQLSKLTNVVDKQFASLDGNQDRIVSYLDNALSR